MSFFRRKSGRLALGALLVVGGTALFLLWKSRPSPAAAAFERGKQLAAIGMIIDAGNAYMEAIQKDPRYTPPYRAIAEMSLQQGYPETSVEYWRKYLEREPQAVHARCQLAYSELMAGQEVPALRDAEEEIKRDAQCRQAHLIAGVLYARKSEPKRALEHLEFAARAYPDRLRVQQVYARVLALTGSYDRAEEVLRGILKRDQSHAEPFLWLGYVYTHRPSTPENERQAEQNLKQALALQPSYPEANYELARLYLRQGQPQKALPYAERAVKSNRHYPAALDALTKAYRALGRQADAARAQRDFLRESRLVAQQKALLRRYALDPNDVEAALALGKVLIARGAPHSALLFLRDAARRAPNDTRIQAEIARAERQPAPAQRPETSAKARDGGDIAESAPADALPPTEDRP